MRPLSGGVPPAGADQGFSLVEVLVALSIFLVATLGVLAFLGAAAAGGFQEAVPTALAAGRRAKDLTVAAVYLQALQDYLAAQDEAVWEPTFDGWPSGREEQTYCTRPGGSTCDGGEPLPPAAWGAYPLPPAAPYQLAWSALRITVQRWHWDCSTRRFSRAPEHATQSFLVHVRATLEWRFRNERRTLAPQGGGLDRLLPYRPAGVPVLEVCR